MDTNRNIFFFSLDDAMAETLPENRLPAGKLLTPRGLFCGIAGRTDPRSTSL